MLCTRRGCKAIWHQRQGRNINPFVALARSWFCSETPSTEKSGVVSSKDSTCHLLIPKTPDLTVRAMVLQILLFIVLMKATRICPRRTAFKDKHTHTCFYPEAFPDFPLKILLNKLLQMRSANSHGLSCLPPMHPIFCFIMCLKKPNSFPQVLLR